LDGKKNDNGNLDVLQTMLRPPDTLRGDIISHKQNSGKESKPRKYGRTHRPRL